MTAGVAVPDTLAVLGAGSWGTALAALVARHGVELIAVGNGTASRETDALAAELVADPDAQVALVAPKPLQMLVPREKRAGLVAKAVFDGPIEAPIAKGQVLGALVVELPGQAPARFDLVAGADVPRGGLGTRLGAAAQIARDRAFGLLQGIN